MFSPCFVPHTARALRRLFLAALLTCLGAAATHAQSAPEPAASTRRSSRSALAASLYSQVSEIAGSVTISSSKKEKRIATAVRVAVIAGAAYKSDPEAVLAVAVELARAAARAAPRYADTIANAAAFAPPVARIDGSAGRIRTATYAAAKGPKGKRPKPAPQPAAAQEPAAPPAEAPHAEAPAPASVDSSAEAAAPAQGNAAPSATVSEPAPQAPDMGSGDTASADASMSDRAPAAPRMTQGENSKLSVTDNTTVERDNNIFISNTNKVADTIYMFEPGLDFHTGDNALNHAALSYQENFIEYAAHKAPDVSLADVNGAFGYDDGSLKLNGKAYYQQLFQNNLDVLTVGPQALIRSNVVDADGVGELAIGAKTGVSLGADYNKTTYQSDAYVSGSTISLPLDFYFKLTPKVDLFAGYTYSLFRPDTTGPEAKDGYYHVGARGVFTAKLSGTVSAGYLTREVPGAFRNNSLGFNGNLAYEVTAKTSASLAFSRDYTASALGQNLRNSTFTLGVVTEISPQWEIGETVNYRNLNYGPQVFLLENTLVNEERIDNYWTGTVHLSYIYSRWLTASAAVTIRNDRSSVSQIDFADNVLSFTLGLRY